MTFDFYGTFNDLGTEDLGTFNDLLTSMTEFLLL